MHRFSSLAALSALAIAACAEPSTTSAPSATMRGTSATSNVVAGAGMYLVKFKDGVPADFASSVAKLGGTVIWAHNPTSLAGVDGLTASAAAALAARKDVAVLEADAYTILDDPASVDLSANGPESASDPTGAFRYARQWNMRAIHADAAWAAGKLGKSTTRVGILDTGIGYTHLDLDGRVDLSRSISLLPDDENAKVEANWGPGVHTIADLHYHGTHVSATVVSNAVRAAGVTSGVTLVGVKVCRPTGSCPTSSVLGGILYLADEGVDVANLSVGGAFYKSVESARGGLSPAFVAIINSVFNYAYNKGTLMVVSAGNSAMDLDHNGNVYSAYCNAPHVVCVSALGPTSQVSNVGPWTDVDALAYYSNFGRSGITVGAPGGNNSSFVYAACSPFNITIGCGGATNLVVGLQGTSMAAPHVTGLAALIAGEVGHNPDAIVARLTGSADDLGAPGTDPAYGKGRINVAHAMGVTY